MIYGPQTFENHLLKAINELCCNCQLVWCYCLYSRRSRFEPR